MNRSYWSTDLIYHMLVFSAAVDRKRNAKIMHFMQFSGNTHHKIRPLINYLSQKCAEVYTPQQNIFTEEYLVYFTGRLAIKQYHPSKHARYEVKLYKLCERATGYM